MRAVLTSIGRWPGHGWFWLLALLVLPNCSFDVSGLGPSRNLSRGPTPHDSAIFCDIEQPLVGRRCSTEEDRAMGIRLADAALALNEGRVSNVALDDSLEARARCDGQPEAVLFQGPFPDGLPVCLNCGAAIPASHADVNAACEARCQDYFGSVNADGTITPEVPAAPATVAFCAARARTSTNAPVSMCFGGACNDLGTLRADFADPRRIPQPVVWTDFIGTSAGGPVGADLTRTAAQTGSYDAGAVSQQWITRGSGYVEFSVANAGESHFLGLTGISPACPPPCADTDPSFASIRFAIMLHFDGRYYVSESGVGIPGPDLNGSFGTYTAGDRFRVNVRDNADGTATISYSRVIGPCTPGTVCNQTVFRTSSGTATYPLRVDTSIRELGATLTDVRLVHIQ